MKVDRGPPEPGKPNQATLTDEIAGRKDTMTDNDMQKHIVLSNKAAVYEEARQLEIEALQFAGRVHEFHGRAKDVIGLAHYPESFVDKLRYSAKRATELAGVLANARIVGDIDDMDNERERAALVAESKPDPVVVVIEE